MPLDEHDRSRYDRALLREGQALVVEALRREPGPYGVQAAIAALHSAAPTASETDWQQIVRLYDVLSQMVPTPVVALNRAVAISFADDPELALSLLDDLASDLPRLRSPARGASGRAAPPGSPGRGGGCVSRGAGGHDEPGRSGVPGRPPSGALGGSAQQVAARHLQT